MKTSIRIIALLAALFLAGCVGITGYKASEVHQTVSFPLLFSDTIDAVGIKKETQPDGTVVRKADTLSHTTTVGGYSRQVVYKDAEIESKK